MLTAEQIKERLETAFLPHTATATIHDYGAKITVRVQSKDGEPLLLGPDWSVDELREDFEGRITGIRREIEDKLKLNRLLEMLSPEADARYRQQTASGMLPDWAIQWCLATSTDASDIATLETATGDTQAEALTGFVEESCWSEQLPQFAGGRGTLEERRAGLVAAYRNQEIEGWTNRPRRPRRRSPPLGAAQRCERWESETAIGSTPERGNVMAPQGHGLPPRRGMPIAGRLTAQSARRVPLLEWRSHGGNGNRQPLPHARAVRACLRRGYFRISA